MTFLEYATVAAALFFVGAWTLGLTFRPDQRVKCTVVTVIFWWAELLAALAGAFFVLHLLWLFPVTLALPARIQEATFRGSLVHPSLARLIANSSAILVPIIAAVWLLSEGRQMWTMLWIVLAIASLPILWWLLKVATAFAVPQRVAGIALFRQELSKRGIPHAHLPPAFFEAVVTWAEQLSQFPPGRSTIEKKADFVKAIENLATMVQLWCQRPNDSIFEQHGSTPNPYRTLFEPYNLRGDA